MAAREREREERKRESGLGPLDREDNNRIVMTRELLLFVRFNDMFSYTWHWFNPLDRKRSLRSWRCGIHHVVNYKVENVADPLTLSP